MAVYAGRNENKFSLVWYHFTNTKKVFQRYHFANDNLQIVYNT